MHRLRHCCTQPDRALALELREQQRAQASTQATATAHLDVLEWLLQELEQLLCQAQGDIRVRKGALKHLCLQSGLCLQIPQNDGDPTNDTRPSLRMKALPRVPSVQQRNQTRNQSLYQHTSARCNTGKAS